MSEPLFIFGYGSLIWRPPSTHIGGRPAHVKGWARRFWQGSTDHRGIPGAPGRVVTLVPDPDAVCWGRVFTVRPTDRARVVAELDHREKGGYERHVVTATYADATLDVVESVVYIATKDNPNYLGPAPLDSIADQVVASVGPSGPNPDYVLNLDEALRAIDGDDPHVSELAKLVRARLAA